MKMTEQEKADRKLRRNFEKQEKKRLEIIEAKRNQKPIESMRIEIIWKRSRTWGSTPYATAAVHYKDGTFANLGPFKTFGCGYDKQSTVIAEIFNATLAYKFFKEYNTQTPYGINTKYKIYDGGVGMSCYYRIAEYIGGKLKDVYSNTSTDVLDYTDNE